MISYHSVNGKIQRVDSATIKITDLGLLRGYGIFDYFQIKSGRPFFMDDHLARFYRSAKQMQLEVPFSIDALETQIWALVKANGTDTCGIRLLLTGGYSEDGFTPAASNVMILQHPFKVWNPSIFEKGATLLTHEHVRSMPEIKTTNYYTAILLLPQMKAIGANDVLYHDSDGWISETSRSNFFIITPEQKLVTPQHQILHGITRRHTLEVADGILPIEIRNLHMSELETAKEAFITSTTKGILPIVQIGDQVIGKGKPGPMTQQLMAALAVRREGKQVQT